MTKFLLPTLCLLTILTACGDPKPAPSNPGGSGHEAPMDDHGTPHPLGSLTIGAHTFEVIQEGEVAAGHEAALDLKFAEGKTLPGTVRAWIGVESGQGSMKGRLTKESARVVHGHVEVPKPIPEGSKIWIEIEENDAKARASVAFHR